MLIFICSDTLINIFSMGEVPQVERRYQNSCFYDIEAQVPVLYTVTTASKHDSTALYSIRYEPNAN